jgi:hypothetical protein
LTQCGTPVGEAVAQPGSNTVRPSKEKIARSYTDSLPEQVQNDDGSAFMTYAIEVLNAAGRGAGLSNQVRVSLAHTLPPPQYFSAHVAAQGVVLTWTGDAPALGPTPSVHYVYRVYRREEGNAQQILAGELPSGSERRLSLTDSGIEWEKTYEYHAETVTVLAGDNQAVIQIEGDDTTEVKVLVHDVFPPAVPSGLQAVSSGPGQKTFIDLVWAPVTEIDLDGYNVYRHEDGEAPVKLNAEPLKTPAYRDANVTSGKRYFYSVSAVDVRGNESSRSEEASEKVP